MSQRETSSSNRGSFAAREKASRTSSRDDHLNNSSRRKSRNNKKKLSRHARRQHQQQQDRFESKFHSMQSEDNDLYNVMVTKLEHALEQGQISFEDDDDDDDEISIVSHREQAHILLHEATSKYTKKVSFADEVDYYKYDNRRRIRNCKRIEEDDEEESDGSNDDNDDNEMSDGEIEQDINNTRNLLAQAAAQLQAGGTNLVDGGLNNIIYERLMAELQLNDSSKKEQQSSQASKQNPSISTRAQQRAAAAAGFLPHGKTVATVSNPEAVTRSPAAASSSTIPAPPANSDDNSPAAMRARREYAAMMLTENNNQSKNMDGSSSFLMDLQPSSIAVATPPSHAEKHIHAMERLRSIQEQQKQQQQQHEAEAAWSLALPSPRKATSLAGLNDSQSTAISTVPSSQHSRRSHGSLSTKEAEFSQRSARSQEASQRSARSQEASQRSTRSSQEASQRSARSAASHSSRGSTRSSHSHVMLGNTKSKKLPPRQISDPQNLRKKLSSSGKKA